MKWEKTSNIVLAVSAILFAIYVLWVLWGSACRYVAHINEIKKQDVDTSESLVEGVKELGNSAIQCQEELMECRREIISIRKKEVEELRREEAALRALLKAVKEKK